MANTHAFCEGFSPPLQAPDARVCPPKKGSPVSASPSALMAATQTPLSNEARVPLGFMRTKPAAEYLRTKYGIGSASVLTKLRMTGNSGPRWYKLGSKAVVYAPADLDAWALSQLTERRSTSDPK